MLFSLIKHIHIDLGEKYETELTREEVKSSLYLEIVTFGVAKLSYAFEQLSQ